MTQSNSLLTEHARTGGYLSFLGAITNLMLFPWFFVIQYKTLWDAELAKTDISAEGCAMVIKWFYPLYTDLGTLSGILFLLAAYLFFTNYEKWGYIFAIIAVVNGLMWSFWPAVPAMDLGYFPYHMIIFILNFIYYLILTLKIYPQPKPRVLMGMLMGMAMITSFMNGVANTNRMIIYHADPLYVFGQRLNFLAGLTWMVIIVTLLLWPHQPWIKPVTFAAASLELVVGLPIGIAMSISKATFSMFLLGSIFSALVLLILFMGTWWEKATQPAQLVL